MYHVLKFGGSNLKKKDDIQRIVEVIGKYKDPVVIVVSAFYGVTNILIDHLQRAKSDENCIQSLIADLSLLKMQTLEEVVDSPERRQSIFQDVLGRAKELERFLQGVNLFGEAPDFVADTILSYGERLSSLMLTSILNEYGIAAQEMLPENMGLVTDGEFGNATVDFEASSKAVKKALKGKQVVVVPGFYGLSPQGKVTLLGRGGSDYSAAAIAKCIHAASLDLFKDVDGFLSADPKYVDSPRRIQSLSYMESAELSYFGAKILHPRTVEPLQELGIPIRIFNIATVSDLNAPLTVIEQASREHDDVIKSVTFSDSIGVLTLNGPGVGNKPGILSRVTSAFENAGLNIKSVITSQTSINFLIETDYLGRARDLVQALDLHSIGKVTVQDDISVIAAVGSGIMEKVGLAGKMFTAVSDAGINIELISLGASPVAAYFIVKKAHRAETIRAIHGMLNR